MPKIVALLDTDFLDLTPSEADMLIQDAWMRIKPYSDAWVAEQQLYEGLCEWASQECGQ